MKRRVFPIVLLVTLAAACYPNAAWACATCFGDPEAPQTQGLNGAIVTLLAITYTLLGGIALGLFFLIRNGRRAKNADPEGASSENAHG